MRQFDYEIRMTTMVDQEKNTFLIHVFGWDESALCACDDLDVLDMTGNIDAFRP